MLNEQFLEAFKKGPNALADWRVQNPDTKKIEGLKIAVEGVKELKNFNLSKLEFIRCEFPAVLFRSCNFSYTSFNGCSMVAGGNNYFAIGFEDCEFTLSKHNECNWSHLKISDSDFGRAKLKDVNFSGSMLQGNTASNATFKLVSFNSAHFPKALTAFTASVFEQCDFSATSFGSPYEDNTNVVFRSSCPSPLKSSQLKNCDFAQSRGFEFDENYVETNTLRPVDKRRFWETQVFGAYHLTRYENLKFHYTGVKSLFIVLLTILFFLPILLEITLYKGQNRLQAVGVETVTAIKGHLEDLPPQIPEEWERKLIDVVSISPCLADECKSVATWKLVLGTHKGFWWVVLTVSLLAYNGVRMTLTYLINGFRDFESDTGQTPALSSYGWMWWLHIACKLLYYISIVNFLVQFSQIMMAQVLVPL